MVLFYLLHDFLKFRKPGRFCYTYELFKFFSPLEALKTHKYLFFDTTWKKVYVGDIVVTMIHLRALANCTMKKSCLTDV